MEKKQIVIIGAGGHGRVAEDIAYLNGYDPILFLDDGDVPNAVGKIADYVNYVDNSVFFVAIGNNRLRKEITRKIQAGGARIVSLIHPTAVIARNVPVGTGTIMMAGSVINPGAKVGEGVILNTLSSVDHDNVIHDFAHISAGAHLAGTVTIGECTFVGVGVTVSNNIDICADCLIGCGAVVVRNITEPGIYKGVPAKK